MTDLLKAINQATLAPLVRQALRSDTVDVANWEYRPIHGGASDFGTGMSGIYRFTGQANDRGEIVPWSLILKVVGSPAHGGDPQGGFRELRAYQSALLDNLTGSLVAPRCFGIVEQPAEVFWLWLEEITDDIGPQWPLSRYGLAARHLGQFNGAYMAGESLASWPWLSRDWLRMWVAQRAPEVDILHTNLEHPLVRRFYPADVADGTFRFWAERDTFLNALDHVPQTLCHRDAFRRNLFARRDVDGRDQTIAIDWAFVGTGALGEEIVPLVSASLAFFEVELAEAQALEEIVFEGHLDGLRDAGWRGDPRAVRFAYAAASALRYLFPIGLNLLLEESGRDWLEQAFGRTIGDALDYWANCRRFLLGLTDEARELLSAL